MHMRTKINFLGQGFQKLEPEQYRQTDREMRPDALAGRTCTAFGDNDDGDDDDDDA